MCCGGDKTAKAAEQAQAAFTQTLQASFQTAFGANQAILGALNKTLTDQMLNPKGFDPKTLALLKTSASDTVAKQTQQALVAAGAYGASHGGATLGSGVQSQIMGSILGAGAGEQAREASNIDIQSGLLQNENYWRAVNGLTNVAAAYNPTGYAGAANQGSSAVADLSRAVLASQQAGWQNIGGIISGIAGLGTAAVGAYTGLGFGPPKSGGGSSSTG